MKRLVFSMVFGSLAFMATLICSAGSATAVDSQVCSSGLGVPPFLSSGVDANLLLVIDNSGSMLDTAYTDVTGDGSCVDNDFYVPDPVTGLPKTYAGLFDSTEWYTWNATEGVFQKIPLAVCTDAATQKATQCPVADVLPHLPVASGVTYQGQQLYVKVVEDAKGVQTAIATFAATGNLLNWASASKLDIQKKILTGGKYDKNQGNLISEGRGCSGSNFIKEVGQLTKEGSVGPWTITFSIRGPNEEEKVSDPGDTTRIAILAVGTQSFIGSDRMKACQNVVNEFAKAADADPKTEPQLGSIQQDTATCLAYDGTNNVLAASNAAYNHSIQECWSIVKFPEKYTGPEALNITSSQTACQHVYLNGVIPSTIDPADSGYVCHGTYNSAVDLHNYVGRCWIPGNLPPGCASTPCSSNFDVIVGNTKCSSSDQMLYQCSGSISGGSKPKCNGTWTPVLKDDPDPPVCDTSAKVSLGQWVTSNTEQCIQQGVWDYCASLKVPEVIDPTSTVFSTSETWGMIGALIDSGVVALLKTDKPLTVMKGIVKVSASPKGLIHETAELLRMGVMAFNTDGAKTECDPNSTIVKNCLNNQSNKDGAKIIAPIKDGKATTGGMSHVAYLVEKINSIRAESWTPLAEAMFNALGYYGQNTDYRIDPSDFATATEDSNYPDPVQFWCQGNYVLIITEGASTADINDYVKQTIASLQAGDSRLEDAPATAAQEGECTKFGDHYLYGSTYFDDLTFFGQHTDIAKVFKVPKLLTDDGSNEEKRKITTYIVKTGSPSADGTTGECNADTLMTHAANNGGTDVLPGENPAALEASLRTALNTILNRASAGSAASVISSSRGGEGAIYQAIFWPELERTDAAGKKYPVAWAGDVHGLFIDDNGYMYEDTNHDRTLDKSVDKRVIIYFDETANRSKACLTVPTEDVNGKMTCSDQKELEAVNFLWSASDWLSDFPVNSAGQHLFDALNTETNRTIYNSNQRNRFIFTWNDKNHNGIVDYSDNEVMALEPASESALDPEARPTSASWNSLAKEFNARDGYELNNIISWLRGKDWLVDETPKDLNHNGSWDAGETDPVPGDGPPRKPQRNRQSVVPGSTNTFTWRLGDVIHSTPQAVSDPAEGYHLIYNDFSYVAFVEKYKSRRRHMVYFGANDGMLHAVNAGFFSDIRRKFCLAGVNKDGTCSNGEAAAPALGAEMWAYVPYNLHPHVKCLTDPSYSHKYYVDLKPRVFDAQIFTTDSDHPNGWGTILVGGLSFGGTPVSAKELDATDTTNRKFISSYFILDITNPEKEPVLLGELTQELDATGGDKWVDLGYSTVSPSMVIAKTTTVNKWYLVFGSGPHGNDGLKGVSDQQAKISVLPLEGLVGSDNKPVRPLRIDKGHPSGDTSGTFLLPNDAPSGLNGFVSDPITVDFDINPSVSGQYVSDAVYFGTVEGNFDYTVTPYWKGGGHLYRLVMDGNGHEVGDNTTYTPDTWAIRPLLDLSEGSTNRDNGEGQPITAAPAVGTDGYNYWIYFGTGRFFDRDDKTDSRQQSFYGIKEPMAAILDASTGKVIGKKLTWGTVKTPHDPTVYETVPGKKGLLRVDQILVKDTSILSGSKLLTCRDNSDCLPTTSISTFKGLADYIVTSGPCVPTDNLLKENCCSGSSEKNCVDGWYKDFYPYNDRERNLGQATLLGGLVTFTTYQPYNDPCKAEGQSNLFAVHYQTGTPWFRNIFGKYGLEGEYVKDKLSLGHGLTITPNLFTGKGAEDGGGVKAFIQTSTGEIKEIKQENLPLNNYQSGRDKWKEYQRP